MASTSSNQIPSSAPTLWNVFLSFRGKDTRTGFTSHLYDALDRNGTQTFMDDSELHSGEMISYALLNAIQKSKIYIVVLSENYASSTWCLDELVEILKCSKEFGRLVIPVFYKIDPSVVRRQIGSFKAAFENHEKVHFVGMDKLNEWHYTLSQVADFSGHHVDQTRSEVDIINEVVDAVLREVNPMTINVAKYPVGIDSPMAEITPLLTSGTQGIHYIGIWGMGGVGKTTLAKAVYNANFGSFEGSCFLANVTEVSGQPNGPQGLQAQLIADVLKVKKSEIDSIDEGIEQIRQRICSKKVLIVVDDLNDQKQLDALVVGPFACGSVIILTTRKEDLLATVGVEATYRYMLNELGDAHSRQLFNKHAFRDENPSDTFLVLSEEILHHARGLPLAIEIFGSTLCNQSEAEWRRFIGQLKKVVNPKIQEKLVISFESLADRTLKEMFLDIACFFVGNRREDVVPILGSCYEDVDANIDYLKSRCLVKIDENNQFSVHDLVQDMGWEIARQSYDKDELEKHSRVRGWKDIYNVLDDNMEESKAIKGMVHHYDYGESDKVTFDTKTFKRIPKLRFLKMKDINLTGSFEQIFKELTWLHWYRCPLKSLSSDFYPKKLVILELRGSGITRWKLTKDLRNLKILDLSDSEELITIPDFYRLTCLEKIKLRHCRKLMEVDTTIGELRNLVSLDLSGCTGLRRLPDSVCKLTALENLDLGNCDSLEELPEELGNIVSLTRLVVGSPHISKLPDSIARLSKLVELILFDNEKLETLGDTFSNMRSLEILNIYKCGKLENLVPFGINQLSNVQLPPNLKSLEVSACRSMRRLPNLSNLKQLKRLELRNSSSLREIEGLEELGFIPELNLERCESILRLPDLSNLRHLKELNLGYCSSLIEIKGLATCIRYLKFTDCASLKKLPSLSSLKQLWHLDLRNCSSLKEIEGLEGLASIALLQLAGCDSTMVSKTLTSSLFQIYSEFGNKIEIDINKGDTPNWMSHSGRVCTVVRTNVSYNFLGLLLSFACYGKLDKRRIFHQYIYIINNERNDMYNEDAVMLMVPREDLIKSCGGYHDEATIFQVTAWCSSHKEEKVKIGVHPLHKLPPISHASALTKRKRVDIKD